MIDIETIDLINRLIKYADDRKHIEFHFLRCWSEYKYYKNKRKAFKHVCKMFRKIIKRYSKRTYSNANTHERLQQLLDFYTGEFETVTEMIYEYEAYLLSGNYLSAFAGEVRAEEDMIDFRGRDY